MSQPGFHPPERKTPPPKAGAAQEAATELLDSFAEDHTVIASSLLAIALKATGQVVPQGLMDHLKELGDAFNEDEPQGDGGEQTDGS